MAKRPINKARLKVWTERSTAEMSGGTKDVAFYLFMFVPEPEREALLLDMQEWHAGTVAAAKEQNDGL